MKITIKMSKQDQQKIYSIFKKTNSILYHPSLALALGSPEAAIILGQLLYWRGHGRYGNQVYKTIDQMKHETGLTRTRQETAIKKLKKIGLIRVKLAGVPAKRHFRVDMNELIAYLSSLQDSYKLVRTESIRESAGIQQTITKNTKEIHKDGKHYKEFVRKKENLYKKMGVK